MASREDVSEESKEKLILDASMDEFIEKGWSGARMQSIADRAGINKTLLHYYFRSKEKLYEKTVYAVMGHLFGVVLGNIDSKDDFKTFLKTFIDTVVDQTARHPRIPLFVMQELSRGGRAVRAILSDVLNRQDPPATRVMLDKIQEAVDEGEIRAVDPVQFMLTLLGACLYFAMAEPIVMEIGRFSGFTKDFNRDQFLETRKREIFSLLYYGIGNEERGDSE